MPSSKSATLIGATTHTTSETPLSNGCSRVGGAAQ